MSIKSKIKWGRRGWERIDQPAPVEHNLIVAALHTLAARVTSLEQQIAVIANTAAPPAKRGRKPSQQG